MINHTFNNYLKTPSSCFEHVAHQALHAVYAWAEAAVSWTRRCHEMPLVPQSFPGSVLHLLSSDTVYDNLQVEVLWSRGEAAPVPVQHGRGAITQDCGGAGGRADSNNWNTSEVGR